ncbi:juvenile hormone esterase [Papilio machaon]|uniref:juvenile hormone esterase n=1 Tax=Papilio machaon TaxID=76193 RepID=UPI001E6645CB|nr:juvenile hormone esterase [Papilio machaon]XP_014364666.2 juvenile hormone esterase [Papilio machaon]
MRAQQWVALWSLWAARLVPQRTPTVRVSGGLLRGYLAPDGSHAAYLGIPYATAGRFQVPKPAPGWSGVLEAQDEHIRCIQRFTATTILGTEDNCLTLNVYTPINRSPKLPVMVYIHGGGFRDGSGSPYIYGPEYLVRQEVILVTLNYRLEVMGFLCLGIKEAPGNAGLKDQLEALRWVKTNIEAFGGDPNSITLFGESAGSASVMYHLLSPMSAGLFDRAIMQSGSAMSPWSFQFEPVSTASALAAQLGYNTSDPYELYNIFINTPAEKLLSTRVPRARGDVVLSENIFVPCAEKKIEGSDQFLSDTPYNLLILGKYTKLPIIVGFNSAEGYMFVGKENDTTISNMNFIDSLPRDLSFPTMEEKKSVADTFNELYMNHEKISKNNLVKFSRYPGESGITYPVAATVDLMLQSSERPLYAYQFSYSGWMNVVKQLYGFAGAPGATHADELFYLFKLKAKLFQSFLELDMVDKMTTMWTNFAKYGDPTPAVTQLLPVRWPPTQKNTPRILVIDKEFTTAALWSGQTLLFWNETYSKYRRKS